MASTSTTLTQNVLNNKTNSLQYAFRSNLLDINTMLPCQIEVVNDNGTYDVVPIVNVLDATGTPHINPKIREVPAIKIVGGNAGVIIEYAVNDIVYVGFCQRDISLIKETWTTQNPPSYRLHNLADGIILGKLSNEEPTINIKLTAAGIEINAPGLPITTNSASAVVNADSVKLGNGASSALLLEGVALTANIGGVQGGGGVTNVPITVTAGGSSKVEAAI